MGPNVAPVLDVARATDLTVEVNDPPTPHRLVRPNLAPGMVTTDPVVVIEWIVEPSPDREYALVRQYVEARVFENREMVIERGEGRDGERGGAERRETAARMTLRMEALSFKTWYSEPRSRPYPGPPSGSIRPTLSCDIAYSDSPAASRAFARSM